MRHWGAGGGRRGEGGGAKLTKGVALEVLGCTTVMAVLFAGTAALTLISHPNCRPEGAVYCTGCPVGWNCSPYPHLAPHLQA